MGVHQIENESPGIQVNWKPTEGYFQSNIIFLSALINDALCLLSFHKITEHTEQTNNHLIVSYCCMAEHVATEISHGN